ncbi:MAG: THUMP domain-containing class I SAM-dependent RNA methyltransferase, partial [Planctomycetota bacterium]
MPQGEPNQQEFHAPCPLGVEAALARELEQLGARRLRPRRGGITFFGDRRLGYACNLWLRSAIRVQELLLRRPVRDADDLYRTISKIDWSRFMAEDQTLAVDASVRSSKITHSKFAALRTKDAIVDQFRARTGRRPSVDVHAPDLPLKAVIQEGTLSLYRNLSGESLHKRGWRPIQVKAPLNEALAAGLLILSGWDRKTPLVDPMCGAGTFLIEAACMAADRAPGLQRIFAFEAWPDLDRRLWQQLRRDAERRAQDQIQTTLTGADHHGGALALARQGALAAGVADMIRFHHCDVRDFVPTARAPHVMVNPPYGQRLGDAEQARAAWDGLGNFLHQRCQGGRAFVLCGDRNLSRLLGLRASRRLPVRNGPIDCRLLCYEIRERGT